jgi:polyisoprenyl-teichoic acid--peptidoglycan teichoic acid transferase
MFRTGITGWFMGNEVLQRRFTTRFSRLGMRIIAAVLLLVLALGCISSVRFMQRTGISPVVLFRLMFDDGIALKSTDNRTNVLLLGIGGGDHEGSDLTDTMIVLSLDRVRHTAALLSIPRDIWSDTLRDKVNSAYHYGEETKKGGGILLAKTITEDVIGLPIHYAILIDFTGFKNIIDLLGGIDVVVTKAFTDTKFPIAGKEHSTCPGDPTNACVYETVHFDGGLQHMNGDRALIYVRSRHSEGEEGSDFARSRRQQEVLLALKDTLMHPIRWMTVTRLKNLPKAIDDATDMDMNIGELLTVGRIYIRIKESDVKKIAIDDLLIEGEQSLYNGLYVLVPKDDWITIHDYIAQNIQ